ncbi:MAG: response regulator [Minwuia sp.]|uniref:response regulator n=1 Tax=Minwuia sp. TaxID=2493630 RepID=UPI003A849331
MTSVEDPASFGRDERIVILMVDDDPDDIFLTRRAFQEGRLIKDFHAVGNGREMLDYLHNRGAYSDSGANPRPHIILLDINMPMMNGFEALDQVRRDPDLADIPIVMLTTSRDQVDVSRCYAMGANSFISKPMTPSAMRDLVRTIEDYWFDIAEIPRHRRT